MDICAVSNLLLIQILPLWIELGAPIVSYLWKCILMKWIAGSKVNSRCQVWGPHPNPRWYQFAVHQQHMREPVSALTLTEQLVKPYFHQSDRSEMLAQFSFNLHFSYYEKGWASIQIFKGALHFCPMNSPFLFHPVFYWLPSIQS